MSLFKKANDPDTVTQLLLKSLGIQLDIEAISVELEKHPEALDNWHQQKNYGSWA